MNNPPYTTFPVTFYPNSNSGWQCPRCQRVYSPTMTECYHCNNVNRGIGTGYPPFSPFGTTSMTTGSIDSSPIQPPKEPAFFSRDFRIYEGPFKPENTENHEKK